MTLDRTRLLANGDRLMLVPDAPDRWIAQRKADRAPVGSVRIEAPVVVVEAERDPRLEIEALAARLARALGLRGRYTRATVVRTGVDFEVPDDYRLARVAEPAVLQSIGVDLYGREAFLAPDAARAWDRMRRAALAEDVTIEPASAWRSARYQVGIIERKRARGQSLDEILAVSAAPGYSEHHSGRAIDVATSRDDALEEVFETTPAFAWLSANAGNFGFRLSYPRGNPHGVIYEPWHWYYAH